MWTYQQCYCSEQRCCCSVVLHFECSCGCPWRQGWSLLEWLAGWQEGSWPTENCDSPAGTCVRRLSWYLLCSQVGKNEGWLSDVQHWEIKQSTEATLALTGISCFIKFRYFNLTCVPQWTWLQYENRHFFKILLSVPDLHAVTRRTLQHICGNVITNYAAALLRLLLWSATLQLLYIMYTVAQWASLNEHNTHTLLGSDAMASSCDNEPTDLLSALTQLNLKKSFVTKSFVNSKV